MKWLSEYFQYESAKNGRIHVRRLLGQWRISVDEAGQTTAYTNTMWKEAFMRVAKTHSGIQTICMLGLGAAGGIPYLHKQFPGCRVTAVEYDNEMIEIAKKVGLYKPFAFPRVIEGDARNVIAALQEAFDLIIVDLFKGPEPSALVTDEEFIAALQGRLSAQGACIVNVFRKSQYLEVAKRVFRYCDEYRFRENTLGIFWDQEA